MPVLPHMSKRFGQLCPAMNNPSNKNNESAGNFYQNKSAFFKQD